MSYYNKEIISPISLARKKEKVDLQQLNDRFSTYIQKIRLLNDQTNRLDVGAFLKQTKILEEEMANLKTLYERELDALRLEVNVINREKSNYQLQCEKQKQAAMDFETRLSVEMDKNRQLLEDKSQMQQKLSTLETEVMNFRQTGDGRSNFIQLQREMDKLIRENEENKRRQEQESILRTEAEDKCHTFTKKLEFNEHVHAQQVTELRERLEQSQAMIISLESRLNQAARQDDILPDILKQIREQADCELKQYQQLSVDKYNRNIAALKCQIENDAHTIEQLLSNKSSLQGQIGELHAKIRNLEGQVMSLEHQKSMAEDLIKQDRNCSSEQIQEMTKRLQEMQALVITKMQEASSECDQNISLKAEINALKILLEEEEKRLQLPVAATQTYAPTYTTPLTLPAVAQPVDMYQMDYSMPLSPVQPDVDTQNVLLTNSDTQRLSLDQMSKVDPMSTHVPSPVFSEQGLPDSIGMTKYTYETTPSMNRLHFNSPPTNSPRAVGPISRAKSAPVRQGSSVQIVPIKLGQGKDYFDEMFKDLTRETLYTQTRPRSSPMESAPRDSQAFSDKRSNRYQESVEKLNFVRNTAHTTEYSPESACEQETSGQDIEEPYSSLRQNERPQSALWRDYTTSTTSAVGDVKILEVNPEGQYICLVNEGKQQVEIGGYMLQQNVGGHPVAVFRFPPQTKFPADSTLTVWAGTHDHLEHHSPQDLIWKEQQKWGTGPECTSVLCKPNGQAVAWITASHRITRNSSDESVRMDIEDVNNSLPTFPQADDELKLNLNGSKPEPVFLRREKQNQPSLTPQKHPHGSSPCKDTHPHIGMPRPFTHGNDNSSVNRQSRIQSTRPDPIPGQPYAGSSANKTGSAPLRKFKTTSPSGNIRGSGTLANCSAGYIHHGPPTPFLSPKQQEYSEFRDSRPLLRFST